jgi:hypothetical protein
MGAKTYRTTESWKMMPRRIVAELRNTAGKSEEAPDERLQGSLMNKDVD